MIEVDAGCVAEEMLTEPEGTGVDSDALPWDALDVSCVGRAEDAGVVDGLGGRYKVEEPETTGL